MQISMTEILAIAVATVEAALATPTGMLALASAAVASALTIISSFLRLMVPLRWLAVGSNVGFFSYGLLYPSLPMMALHGLLLPINIYRAIEMIKLTRRVTRAAARGDLSGVWLKPYMKRRDLKAGTVLFNKGDPADLLYFLAEGRIELVEIGVSVPPGAIFGEIAFFSPDRRRTLTARCAERCRVLTIGESDLHQLYFQNPSFGFELVGLIAGRLSADIQRLEQQAADARAASATAAHAASAATAASPSP
ncbi:MAG: cyclic nucleotide-binding domain-containing protein [Burkholderiaceae bacterium]